MDDKAVLERLLEVLNRIDGRLEAIEASVASTKAGALVQVGNVHKAGTNGASAESPDVLSSPAGSEKGKGVERRDQPDPNVESDEAKPTTNIGNVTSTMSLSASSLHLEQHRVDSSRAGIFEEADKIRPQNPTDQVTSGLNDYYLKMPATTVWKTHTPVESSQSCSAKESETEALWTKHFGCLWSIPPDNRVDLSFQKHVLASISPTQAESVTRSLGEWLQPVLDGLYRFSVTDIGGSNNDVIVYTKRTSSILENEFDIKQHVFATPLTNEPNREMLSCVSKKYWATWNRIIGIQGLACVKHDRDWALGNIESTEEDYLIVLDKEAPFVPISKHRATPSRWIPPVINRFLQGRVRKHLRAQFENPERSAWGTSPDGFATMTFQVVYYALSPMPSANGPDERWPTGRLYNDGPYISLEVLSLCSVARNFDPTIYTAAPPQGKAPEYWTLITLSPDDLCFRLPQREKSDMLEIMLNKVRDILLHLGLEWENIVEHFDAFLDDGKTFLNAKEHDNLLVDDETFSRSRKYFWTLSCLSEFILHINNAIHQWVASRNVWNAIFAGFQSEQSKEYIKENDDLCEKLKTLRDRMQYHHKNVTALRDGLFNASAVMESRASTRLGENVKLLTFVSIFFLPLAFCTSLWSMSDALFPIHILIYVIILVALATYMIVFNLNTLVRLFSSAYDSCKATLIANMKSETRSEHWKVAGERFENFQFRPKAEVVKPSEWLLVGYALTRGMLWLRSSLIFWKRKPNIARDKGLSVRSAKADEPQTNLHSSKNGLNGIFGRMRRFGRRPNGGEVHETTIP